MKLHEYQSKTIFSKYGGSLSGVGSVMWMFKNRGVLTIAKEDFGELSEEQIELLAIDNNAVDVQTEELGVTVICEPEHLKSLQHTLEKAQVHITDATVELVPTTTVADAHAMEHNAKLRDELDEYDDVISVAYNLSGAPS